MEFALIHELQAMSSGTGARIWSRLVHDIGKVKVAGKKNCFTVLPDCLEKFKMLKLYEMMVMKRKQYPDRYQTILSKAIF